MPSNILSPPITDLLLVIVFLVGVCIFFLAEITNATTIGLVGQLLGSLIVIGTLVLILLRRKLGIDQ